MKDILVSYELLASRIKEVSTGICHSAANSLRVMTEAPVLTKEQVELKNLRNRIKQLESLEKEKPELLKEISQLKVKARDAISTETTLTKLQKNYNSLKDQNQEYAGRIQELQVAVDDLNRDIKIYKADAEGCKSQVRKMREELEWEQRFKRGLQKMNEKLETRTKQAEHNLLQQVNHLTLTQEKLHSHEEEVTRERAQRLIELHKLHQCELQMEGLHTKFSKQKQTATFHFKNGGHGKRRCCSSLAIGTRY